MIYWIDNVNILKKKGKNQQQNINMSNGLN